MSNLPDSRLLAWTRHFLTLLLVIAIPTQFANCAYAQKDVSKTTTSTHAFLLTVVGPDGQPVSGANVEWRITPPPEELPVELGTFVKKKKYGLLTKTDEQGHIRVAVSPNRRVECSIKSDGFGPYWAKWNPPKTGNPIPAEFKAQLDAGWVVGSTIVDKSGRPIEGVEVRPSIRFKKRPGDDSVLGVGTRLTTDARGQWRYTMVPAAKSEVHVEIDHPDYIPNRRKLSREEFGIVGKREPTSTVVLNQGLVVTGTVTDSEGKPIAGALVRAKFLNNLRKTTTGEDGTYRLAGCEPRMARFVASAKGFALEFTDAQVSEKTKPVDFEMQPGGHVKIRVVDKEGKGIAKSRIFFQRLDGRRIEYFEFDHVGQRTDENGVWEWNEAPLSGFHADICPPEGTTLSKQHIQPRADEYVFTPPPRLIISGKVTNAKTGKPILEFRVVPGIQGSEGSHIDWVENEALSAKDGKYRLIHLRQGYFAHLIRIEAEGFSPKVSRNIQSNEGSITLNFELGQGTDVNALVKNRDGQPVVGAEVAIGVAGSQISLRNGRFEKDSIYNAKQSSTDENGRIRFSPQVTPYQLVVVHDDGYAHVSATPGRPPKEIELTPWAVVKGTYREGSKRAADLAVRLMSETLHTYGDDVPNIFSHYEASTGKDGTFTFDRVAAGPAWVRRSIVRMVDEGATEVASTPIQFVELVAGESREMDLGGSGINIKGRLGLPKNVKEWNWKKISVGFSTITAPMPPAPVPKEIAEDRVKRQAWMAEWIRTPPGQTWTLVRKQMDKRRRESIRFDTTVGEEGAFQIVDVPEGKYRLRTRSVPGGPGGVTWEQAVEVSKDDIEKGEDLDLGAVLPR